MMYPNAVDLLVNRNKKQLNRIFKQIKKSNRKKRNTFSYNGNISEDIKVFLEYKGFLVENIRGLVRISWTYHDIKNVINR